MQKRILLNSLLLIAMTFQSATFAAANTALTSENDDIIQRVEDLEQQIKNLEDRLPKRIRKIPLDLPHLSTNAAVQESYSRLENMFSLNFIQYHQQVRQNRKYCSKEAFDTYLNFLNKTNWVEQLAQSKSLLYVFPNGSPKVLNEGSKNKHYAWMIEMPLKVTMENNASRKDYPIVVTITIERASELTHPKGMLVSEITFKELG